MLKPHPGTHEAQMRPTLLDLASASRDVHGHYRFFVYSDATVDAIPDAPSWASLQPTPTVCSAFPWRAAQAAGITLNANTADDDNVTLPTTPDGLFHYSERDRKAAADWLYRFMYDETDRKAREEIDALEAEVEETIGEVGAAGRLVADPTGFLVESAAIGLSWTSDVRDDVANQLVDCFASDDCSPEATDSEAWKEPGDGIAVSPDDMISWDLYGHIEPMAYRTGQLIPTYTWLPSAGTARVCGRVVFDDGSPVASSNATISSSPFPVPTDANGAYRFEAVPSGEVSVSSISRRCRDGLHRS